MIASSSKSSIGSNSSNSNRGEQRRRRAGGARAVTAATGGSSAAASTPGNAVNSAFDQPDYFLNRELSWLEFNARVLEEALDPHQPLLERVRFLSIFGTNLDEFFEVRIAGVKQQIDSKSGAFGPDHLSASEVFDKAQKRAHELVETQYRCWNEQLIPALNAVGIFIHSSTKLPPAAAAWAETMFREEIFPVLTPLGVDPSHPFPQLLNKSHNVIVLLDRPAEGDTATAIVQIPRVFPRLLRIPDAAAAELGPGAHHVFLQSLIRNHLRFIFPGLVVKESYAFRMTRNSDLYIDDEEAENLLHTIEEELRRLNKGNAVRLEVQAGCPPEVEKFLLENFRLTEADLYRLPGPVNFLHLQPLYMSDAYPRLRDKPFQPATPKALPLGADIFEVMRRQDVLLHHPYESFQSIVELIERASEDPQVLGVKMTLYRTSADSAIVRALVEAAENGKQVTVLVELKARFDEMNNIRFARRLEEAGVHVVYGIVGLKTHCKMLMIVRRDDDRIRLYTHLGTGNYNASTARFYTDLSLLTTSAELTAEVAVVFNNLTGLSEFHGGKKLMLAPFELRERFHALIARERDIARAGGAGRIIVKLNSLVDERTIVALYEAAAAGVKIDLIVRGVCCLRPGVDGVGGNIRVISIIGRFLEHSRIYWFGNGGDPLVYLGSADWMPRNFDRRVEVVFPVEDAALKARIADEILPAFLNDNAKSRLLRPDGTYERRRPAGDEKPFQAQLYFRNLARGQKVDKPPTKVVAAPVAPAHADAR
ncbi:MAG: polyphosphate kinase 1 [Verrucomicrobia bacterium]|nr:polyphosphate kinase 1 [Verrucomicrobiota bacterium]